MNWIQKTRTFLGDVQGELKKTTWPAWKEVRGTTMVVIVTSCIFALFLWVIDMLVQTVVGRVVALFA
jgi:preprotein translocase SecE subunit